MGDNDEASEERTGDSSSMASSPSVPSENTEATTATTTENTKKKQVQFHPDEKDSSKPTSNQPTTSQRRRSANPAKVGKADPVRDLGVFLGIIVLFYFISSGFKDVGRMPSEDTGEWVEESTSHKNPDSLSRLKKVRRALGKMMEERNHQYPEQTDCGLFLAPSSIPKTGLGLFAGQNYSLGDELIDLGSASPMDWPLVRLEDDASSSSSSMVLRIAPYAWLLKHHPTLVNVQPTRPMWEMVAEENDVNDVDEYGDVKATTTRLILRATQSIVAGDELLLEWSDHLHSLSQTGQDWFDGRLPTLEDYQEADALIFEVRKTFRKPKGQGSMSKQKQKQAGLVGPGLRMIQTVVARYRPGVALLLPTTLERLMSEYRGKAMEMTSLTLGLHPQTPILLRRHGLCLTDVNRTITTTTTTTPSTDAVINRVTTKGSRIHPIPLWIRRKEGTSSSSKGGACRTNDDNDESCVLAASTCWSRPESLIELCPLEPDSFVVVEAEAAATTTTTTTTNAAAMDEETSVTARFEWSTWDSAISVHELTVAQAVEDHRAELLWDLIAARDLTVGDKVRVSLERDSETGTWMIPKSLLPPHWTKEEEEGGGGIAMID